MVSRRRYALTAGALLLLIAAVLIPQRMKRLHDGPVTSPGPVATSPAPAADSTRSNHPRIPSREPPQPREEPSEELDELRVLPYLSGYEKAPARAKVIAYDPELAYNGYNLYNSGHRPEAILMDMEGKVLHRWSFEIERVWPDVVRRKMSNYWRRVHLFPNGDLLAIFDSYGMLKLDKHSNLIWSYKARCHHDLDVTGDGRIYVITRRPETIQRFNHGKPVLPDVITILNSEGELQAEYPLYDLFLNSSYKKMLRFVPINVIDVFHTNSIRVFDGSMEHLSPLYRKGNVLVSIRKFDTVAILDLESKRVVWALSGTTHRLWAKQHDPTLLPNGNMLIFDNLGYGPSRKSKILEFNPRTRETLWVYAGEEGRQLFSKALGAVRGLPNGNVLISESNYGRALEVTRDKKVVWEFLNPNRAGENNELIATLFEMKRIDYSYARWLRGDGAAGD